MTIQVCINDLYWVEDQLARCVISLVLSFQPGQVNIGLREEVEDLSPSFFYRSNRPPNKDVFYHYASVIEGRSAQTITSEDYIYWRVFYFWSVAQYLNNWSNLIVMLY